MFSRRWRNSRRERKRAQKEVAEVVAYPQAQCGCKNRTSAVAHIAVMSYGKAAHDMEICSSAVDALLEETIVCLITAHALNGTAIDCGSQEAQWETERVLEGLEARLGARIRDAYAEALTMTREERDNATNFVKELHSKFVALRK